MRGKHVCGIPTNPALHCFSLVLVFHNSDLVHNTVFCLTLTETFMLSGKTLPNKFFLTFTLLLFKYENFLKVDQKLRFFSHLSPNFRLDLINIVWLSHIQYFNRRVTMKEKKVKFRNALENIPPDSDVANLTKITITIFPELKNIVFC
jgi:hypothetical protein